MFLTLKKRNIILTALTLALALLFAYSQKSREKESISVFSNPASGKVFVIDPGHGGADSGATQGEVYEKDINLEIALMLKAFIEENRGTVIMSRDTDTDTADENRPKTVSRKKSDLTFRKNLPEKHNADIFISIHINKFTDEKYKGAQVFCAPNSPESHALGEAIQSSLIKNADPKNTRELKEGNSIYILKDTKTPSVLVECGFLSNPEEAKLLQSKSYQQKVAWSIFIGAVEFLADK